MRVAAKVLRTSVPALRRSYRRDPAGTFEMIQQAIVSQRAETEAREIKRKLEEQRKGVTK